MPASWLAIAFAVGIGVALSLQPAINAEVARRLDSTLGALLLSLVVSLTVVVAYALLSRAPTNVAALPAAPWWSVAGGVIGALFLLAGLTAAPVIGATLFFLFLIVGQVSGALIVDQFGLFGIAREPISAQRLLGAACVLVGALIAAS